jgi:hypothetical protein
MPIDTGIRKLSMSITNDTGGYRGQAIAHIQGSVSRIDEHTLSKITARQCKGIRDYIK